MVRYAEWREAVDPERPLARFDGVIQFVLALFGGAVGTLCCGLLTIPAFVFAWREVGNVLLLRRVERLRDVPSRHAQVACRLFLSLGKAVYGRDEGLVSLVDGTLLFEGRRTSFSFFLNRAGTESTTLAEGRFIVHFSTPTGRAQALIEGVSHEELEGCYRDWLRQSPVFDDDLVLPPSRPDRQAWRRVDLLQQAALLLLVGGLSGSAIATLAYSWELGAALAIGSLLISVVLRTIADRRRKGLASLEAGQTAVSANV